MAFVGEGVVDAGAAVEGFAAGGDELLFFHGMKDGVDAAFADGDDLGGGFGDGADDFVAVHFAGGEELEDEEFGDAVHEGEVGVFGGH